MTLFCPETPKVVFCTQFIVTTLKICINPHLFRDKIFLSLTWLVNLFLRQFSEIILNFILILLQVNLIPPFHISLNVLKINICNILLDNIAISNKISLWSYEYMTHSIEHYWHLNLISLHIYCIWMFVETHNKSSSYS